MNVPAIVVVMVQLAATAQCLSNMFATLFIHIASPARRLSCSAVVIVLTAACSTAPSSPTAPSPASVVGVLPQDAPPVPPRLDALPPPPALGATRFVAFGDSITYGTLSSFDGMFLFDSPSQSYPARLLLALQRTFPGQSSRFTVVNAGNPGERAEQGMRRIESVLDTYRPDALLLLEGVNDLTFGTSPVRAATAVVEIVQLARTRNVTVLVALMPQTYASKYPNGEERPQAAGQIVPFNNELRTLVTGMQNVHVVDLYSQFGNNRSLMGNDGLHPTEAGYEVMASTFAQKIEAVFPVRGRLQ